MYSNALSTLLLNILFLKCSICHGPNNAWRCKRICLWIWPTQPSEGYRSWGWINGVHMVRTLLILYFVCLRFECRTLENSKMLFSPYGLRGHLEWCGTTHLNAGAKMTKMHLVNLGLTEGQTRSKPSQKQNFLNSYIKLELFGDF